ncbi:MAG: hypothetical protein V2B19_14070 [Pseudomonadota bacterium]
MKRIFPFILLTLISSLSSSCARLPQIVSESGSNSVVPIVPLGGIFPSGRWQLTHAIDAIVMGGEKSGLLGVSVLSSSDRTLRCALMTLEGFVLFAGRFDGRLTVERALPPFDRPGFAKGLIDDLILLFFPPEGAIQQTGKLPDGARVSRFGSSWDGTIDVIIRDDHTWSVHKYASRHRIERSIEASDIGGIGSGSGSGKGSCFAGRLTLKRHGLSGYQLNLRLVDAVALP